MKGEKQIGLRYYLTQMEVSPLWVNLVFGTFSVVLFGLLLGYYKILQPDLRIHLRFSVEMMQGKVLAHPIFFFLVQLVSGFSRSEGVLIYAAAVVFALAQWAKCSLSLQFIREVFGAKNSVLSLVLIVAAQVAIGNSFMLGHYVSGNISPNYFHNGTYLLSMPFALLFLLENYRYSIDNERRRVFRMVVYGVILIFIKPSFLFCWIPVMPFLWLLRYGLNRSLLGILQVAVLLVVCIIIQSQLLKTGSSNFRVVFNPFVYFGTWANHVKVAVASLFFPLIVLGLYRKEFLRNPMSLAFLFLVIQGFIISFSFYDVINGLVSPNMTWQSSAMAYLMLIAAIGIVLKDEKILSWRFVLCGTGLLVQVVCGLRYIQMSILNHSFFI